MSSTQLLDMEELKMLNESYDNEFNNSNNEFNNSHNEFNNSLYSEDEKTVNILGNMVVYGCFVVVCGCLWLFMVVS